MLFLQVGVVKPLFENICGTYIFVVGDDGAFLLGTKIFKVQQISKNGLARQPVLSV
jgi:hypothetical protein